MADRSEQLAWAQPDPGPWRDERPERDRRDSPRVALPLLVRDVALGGSFEPREGDLSIGGVAFHALHPPVGRRFELRFLLPGVRGEVRATAEVLRVTQVGARFTAHLKFIEIALEAELAIARHLEVAVPW